MKLLHARKHAPAATKHFPAGALLRVASKSFVPAPRVPAPAPDALLEKMVSFEVDGVLCAGLVSKRLSADSLTVRLAIPDKRGILIVTDSEIVHPAAGLEVVGSVVREEHKVREFAESFAFEIDKKMVTVMDVENPSIVEDYLNVSVEGLASTFQTTTPADRDGDYVVPTAFKDTLVEFRKNPVMLADHTNRIDNLIGSYSKISTTPAGLVVRGDLSNAKEVRRVRFLVAEGHLKAFSIGGLFYYGADGRAIERVNLYEISMTPVPANPDALFQVRSLGASDVAKLWSSESKSLRRWLS
jgi:HK97 family phage prohead protease